MKHAVSSLLFACILAAALPCTGHGEEYALWNDASYDFQHVRRIYVEALDTQPAQLHQPAKEQVLKEAFFAKAKELKKLTVHTAPLPAPSVLPAASAALPPVGHRSVEHLQVRSSDPSADILPEPAPSAAEQPAVPPVQTQHMPASPEAVLPQEAMQADLYVTAQVTTYRIGSGMIPAHTEWNSYTVQDVFYGRDGRPRWFSRRISYPVYVPDTYVPVACVSVRFAVYDTRTGKAVSLSEDTRTRSSSRDLTGVYGRIIDRFFKNLKKEIEPS